MSPYGVLFSRKDHFMPNIVIAGYQRHPESVSVTLEISNQNFSITRDFEFRDGDAITFRTLKELANLAFDAEQARRTEAKRQEKLLIRRAAALQDFMGQNIDGIPNQTFEDVYATKTA